MKNIGIGVDVGGSHVSCMAYNLTEKKLITKTLAEQKVNNHAEADEIIPLWGDTIKKSIDIVGLEKVKGIGIAMPGPFDYLNGIPLFKGENGKFENIYGIRIPELLKKYLNLPADTEIRFINDATAFAIGEDQIGKAEKYNRSLSITLGTGFGSAFIKKSIPVVEGEEVPDQGCVWHLPFEDGIADDYFSTRGFVGRFEKVSNTKVTGAKEIADFAAKGVKEAQDLFDDFGNKLALFLSPWVTRFGIEILVIGGNISRAYPYFQQKLNSTFKNKGLSVRCSVSELKESASFIGAATLINDSYYSEVTESIKRM